MTELLLLRTRPGPDRMRVLVIGAVDHRTARQFREQMSRLITNEETRPLLVIDLTCCTHADDHGMTALADARATAQAAGKEVRLEGVPPLIEDRMRNHRQDEDPGDMRTLA
jgi:anti-anti-sigma regulatory factor